ncbi:hypothetical protein [Halalkalicoccus salilacus]|uniref:hypothetical protein n=1 Tax=Halalkalicoccus TaxID=332246 RepID=UPI002F963189
MPEKTPNHELNLYAQGEDNWTHSTDMETIEERLVVRDLEENRSEYTPYLDAFFFAKDSETWYLGDGTSWTHLGTLANGTAGNSTTEGIAEIRDHVGPLYQGPYHQTDGSGIVFWAESGLSIHSAVVDTDLSDVSTTTLSIELVEYNGGAANPPVIGSADVEVNGGPERIDLSSLPNIPADGEYVLARTASSNGEIIPCRRIHKDDWGMSNYEEHTYSNIDFLKGTNIFEPDDFGSEGYYYYFFDIEIGDTTNRVMSPWSHDVEEIYMRPRDPEEEFEDVSPRALWIDTS